MKRRNFLNSFALSTIGFSNYEATKLVFKNFNKKIKITLTPWSLIRSGYGVDDPLNIDLIEFPKVAKSLGFNFIDHEMFHYPPNLKPQYIWKMNTVMEKENVQSAVMLTGGRGDIGDKDKSKRKKAISIYKYWIDVASDLNCKAMRNVCSDFITISHEEKLNYAIEGVQELGEYAKSKGIDLLIENHNGYSSDPEWMIQLMQGVELKNIGILGDFTNWTLERNPDTFYPDPYKGFEIMAPYIKAISAKSESFNKLGEENNIDFKKMFEILEKSPNFIFAGVEFSGNEISRNVGASKTRKLIEKYIF
tara:strand:- start:796 stop:1713 length:918 start_codon:yes stop_codon:yes gene_type:complete